MVPTSSVIDSVMKYSNSLAYYALQMSISHAGLDLYPLTCHHDGIHYADKTIPTGLEENNISCFFPDIEYPTVVSGTECEVYRLCWWLGNDDITLDTRLTLLGECKSVGAYEYYDQERGLSIRVLYTTMNGDCYSATSTEHKYHGNMRLHSRDMAVTHTGQVLRYCATTDKFSEHEGIKPDDYVGCTNVPYTSNRVIHYSNHTQYSMPCDVEIKIAGLMGNRVIAISTDMEIYCSESEYQYEGGTHHLFPTHTLSVGWVIMPTRHANVAFIPVLENGVLFSPTNERGVLQDTDTLNLDCYSPIHIHKVKVSSG